MGEEAAVPCASLCARVLRLDIRFDSDAVRSCQDRALFPRDSAMRFDDADEDRNRREQQHARELRDDRRIRAGCARRAARRDGVRDLMQREAGERAELRLGETEHRLQRHEHERERRAEDGDARDGEHGIVRFRLRCARDAHDGRRAANRRAARRQHSERVLDAEKFSRDDVIHRDHDRHDDDGRHEALQPRAHEQHEVQLEAEEDDARAQKLVRDERR